MNHSFVQISKNLRAMSGGGI